MTMTQMKKLVLSIGVTTMLAACGGGSDGKDGLNGANGKDGINGTNGTNGTNGVDGSVFGATLPAGLYGNIGAQVDFGKVAVFLASDNAEPAILSNASLAVDDTAEPAVI
jgi:hypothetical protein